MTIATVKEYWKWPEVSGAEKGDVLKGANVIAAGIDVGSVSSKAAILCDGELYAYGIIRNNGDSRASGEAALRAALRAGGVEEGSLRCTVSTGYGRANVSSADKAVTEIACHARGAQYLCGTSVRTVLDLGGQDSKAIKINVDGDVVDFLMNDKCATGTGRGIEIFADMVCIPVADLGKMSFDVEKEPEPLSSTCITFANSMAMQMMRRAPQNEVLAAWHFSIAWRACIMVQRLGLEADLAITGGVAKNEGITARIERELGITALKPKADPQLAGAIGAALIGTETVQSGRQA